MDEGHDGRAVANFVLDECEAMGWPISNLSLQKIVFFCHAWTLVETGKPLIRHKFEAWEYGPVLPYLYREFKVFDRAPISSRATSLNCLDGCRTVVEYKLPAMVESLLRRVVGFYGRMRATDLVALSHAEGGPWYVVWNHSGPVNPGMLIDDSKIKEFYSHCPQPFSVQ